jgi:Xaa-Pro aminopeptidase
MAAQAKSVGSGVHTDYDVLAFFANASCSGWTGQGFLLGDALPKKRNAYYRFARGRRCQHHSRFTQLAFALTHAGDNKRGETSVASGPNATILQYARAERQMQSGDLLLVDAACNYEYLTGDITRTYPVDGTFSPAQKDIYEIVLAAQEEAMKVARPG